MIIILVLDYLLSKREIIRPRNKEGNIMNLYIESLEGGNYLAATGIGANRTLVRDNKSQPKSFHCLNEIREHFNTKDFEHVWLRQSTPYEEMVGQTDHPGALELEIEW